MIAGIIVTAVGDELVIAHPSERLSGPELATVAGGPALYLLGHVGFRLRMAGSLSWKRLGAALALCVVGAIGAVLPALATAALALAVLVALIVAELVAGLRRRGARAAEPDRAARAASLTGGSVAIEPMCIGIRRRNLESLERASRSKGR